MARKTRKEKIIAELRRKVNGSSRVNSLPSMPTVSWEEKAERAPHLLSQIDSLYVYPVQLIRKDLTKTLLLSILAISLELALFLLLEKHLVLPFIIKP